MPIVRRRTLGDGDRAFLTSLRRPTYEHDPAPVRLVDLFCGCGGMTLGVAEAARNNGRGLDVRLAFEFDSRIYDIYRANFAPKIDLGPVDVRDVLSSVGSRRTAVENDLRRRVGSVDVLVGGPPCQGHSNLNNHTRGMDPKNGLYLAMVRATEIFCPTHVVIENVPSVVRAREGVVDIAIRMLVEMGYRVAQEVLSVATLGIPQLRKRHVIVASRVTAPDLSALLRDSGCEELRDLQWAIGDLVEVDGGSLIDQPSVLSPENLRRAKWLLAHGKFDLPNRLRPACHRDKPSHRYKSMYGRLDWKLPAHTITSGFLSPGQGRYLHPTRLRTITPHEAARIQFFPDWFRFDSVHQRTVLAEAIGNAVPPKLLFAILDRLVELGSSQVRERELHASAG